MRKVPEGPLHPECRLGCSFLFGLGRRRRRGGRRKRKPNGRLRKQKISHAWLQGPEVPCMQSMFECCPTASRRANSHFVVCNQLLNKYGEALAHRKRASTMGKSGLTRLDGTSMIFVSCSFTRWVVSSRVVRSYLSALVGPTREIKDT